MTDLLPGDLITHTLCDTYYGVVASQECYSEIWGYDAFSYEHVAFLIGRYGAPKFNIVFRDAIPHYASWNSGSTRVRKVFDEPA